MSPLLPLRDPDVRRVNLVRLRVGLGDLPCSTPALRALRRSRPDLEVTLVTWPGAGTGRDEVKLQAAAGLPVSLRRVGGRPQEVPVDRSAARGFSMNTGRPARIAQSSGGPCSDCGALRRAAAPMMLTWGSVVRKKLLCDPSLVSSW
jgi:hypothetical protein